MFLAWLIVVLPSTGAFAETFPQPEELQPDVDFWLSVFTEYDSTQGVLHDNRHLGVVYRVVDLPENGSRSARNRLVNRHRDELRVILRNLADGKRDNLSDPEQAVLSLWPEDVSDAELLAAATRIRFQQGLSDRFREGLVRSGRWRGHVFEQLAEFDVPLALAALPHVESSYNPAARSHVGASGIWQFTRSTARRFMRVDHVVDERNDPYVATRGAAQLLAYNYSLTGNWPMAITAYNHGLSGVRRAMREFGDNAYVDIIRNYRGRTFGFASRNFYVAFLAAKAIDEDPQAYFPGVEREVAESRDSVTLPDFVAADLLAESLGVSTATLRRHNPALQATVWNGSKHLPKNFELALPADTLALTLAASVAAINGEHWQAEQLPDLFHVVSRGDTLSQIAQTYRTRVSTLVDLNGLGSRHRIRAGQRLRLPAAGPAPTPRAPVRAADPAPAVVEESPVLVASSSDAERPGETALLSDPSDYSVAGDLSIEVQSLETLGHFADWLGIRTQRLRDLNGLAFRTPVAIGDRLKIDVSVIDAEEFERRRTEFHRVAQDEYFRKYVIERVDEHRLRRGESIWVLSERRHRVPTWLFRQYNPDINLDRTRPGARIRIPVVSLRDAGSS